MPGGFASTPQEESTRGLGSTSLNQPSTTSTAYSSSAHPSTASHATGTTGSTTHPAHRTPIDPSSQTGATTASSTTPVGLPPTGDTASTTSIKSGVPGNTAPHSAVPSGGAGATTGNTTFPTHTSKTSTHPTGSATTRDTHGTHSSGIGGTTGPTTTTGTSSVQNPPFSNRNLHASPDHPTTAPSSGSHGREALAGAAAAAAGYEASRPHGTHGASPTANPVATSAGTGSHPSTSGLTGSGSHPLTTGTTSTTHPASGVSNTHPTTGTAGVTSTLSDRSRPHANVGETTVERSFPLGGHAGEGPHTISTANRLNPSVPDSAAEYREGTHQHGQHTGTGIATTGAGVGAGALVGEESHRHHGHGSHHMGSHAHQPQSGLTGTHGSSHVGRETALGTGAVGVGGVTAHEAGKHHGTGLSTDPAKTTTTSGGVGQSAGHNYNTLNDGTPSGISARDPAHHSVLPGQSTSTSTPGTHGSSNLERDAALGTGVAGVGSGAAYEAGKHHGTGHSTEPVKTTMTSGGVGPAAGHKYNTLGDGTPSGIATSDPAHPQHSSPLATSNRTGPSSTTHAGTGHHVGRDVGTGAGAAGATGLAAHEYEKHRGGQASAPGVERAAEDRSAGGALNHRPVPGYDGPQALPGQHSSTSDAAMRAQQSLNRYPDQTAGEHGHANRGVPAAGGVGAAGAATVYEAEKHQHGRQAPTSASTTAPRGLETTSRSHEPTSAQHGHIGRDTGAATGVGGAGAAAAYEADKHHHGKEGLATSTPSSKDQAYVQRHPELAPGHQSHTGRDTATVAGAGGAGTTAAYEAEKHKHGNVPTRDSKADTTHAGVSSGEEKKPGLLDKILHPSKSKEQEHEQEEKRRAGTTVAARGEPSLDSKHHDTAHGTIPTKTDNISQADPRHSKERTAAMPGSGVHGTQSTGTHHTGGTTAAAGQPGTYESAQSTAQRHGYGDSPTTARTGQNIDPRVDSAQYGSTTGTTQPTTYARHEPGYTGSSTSPGNTTKGHTSRLQEDPMVVGDTAASGTRNAPNYVDDSPSSAKSGGLSGLLHRENPNKLHKDPPIN